MDLLLFPEPVDEPAAEAVPESREQQPEAAAPATGPRPAEWGDLVLLGVHLGRCVTRGLRSLVGS